ncbi:hypothetical protein [Martelella sp. AD-3]|uniref:hypothetical protein n=1 Tax=Martelella sp. AD-3 TaxID=686597 RepID=UPI00190F1DC3|nr:hypothetical protein [Martelella sp. AD-3]|tara:strand:+ start:547 stop:702 length:156 start_codon:yes stop_codon:yes gene_type:complete
MDGSIAVTSVKKLRSLMGFIVRNGFWHHGALNTNQYDQAIGELSDEHGAGR